MADIWLPGYERMPLGSDVAGGTYDETDHPKAVWHTTEGRSIEAAVNAYRPYPPQLIVDPWAKRKVQHIPLNRCGYSLLNSDADDSYCFQVEVVGFAEDTPGWPEDVLQWLGENVARPLHDVMGVPYVVIRHGFHAPGQVTLASKSSPIRISLAELDGFSGHLAHQHIPGDEHWDAGGLRIDRVLYYAKQEEDDVSHAPLTFQPGQNQWNGYAIPPVGASVTIPNGSEAWVHLRCPNRPAKLHGMWFIHHDGRTLKHVPESTLKNDTYGVDKAAWKLPEGCSQVSVLYSSEVPIFAMLEVKA